MKILLSIIGICVWILVLHSQAYAGEGGRVRLPDETRILDAKYFTSQMGFAKSNPAWKTFTAKNPTWQAIWNTLTQNPHRGWG